MASEPTGLRLRGPTPRDQAYIASTFVSSLGMVEYPLASQARGMIVDGLLDKAGVKVTVAAELADSERILGWLCYSPMPAAHVLHFVYVRNIERRHGIAKAMAIYSGITDGRPLVFTCEGPAATWLRSKYPSAHPMDVAEFLA